MKQARSVVVVGLFAAACGGKGSGAKTPAVAAGDPCAAGLHASGVTGRATSWELVASMASTTPDEMCQATACGPDEPVSVVTSDTPVVAVKNDGSWTVIGDLWTADEPQPEATVTQLGDVRWLNLFFMQFGRDEVTLDDGTTQTATVIAGQRYEDFVLDASGKVLFRAVCGGEGDTHAATEIAREGDAFVYTGCERGAKAVRFTAEQASACPAYAEGAQ